MAKSWIWISDNSDAIQTLIALLVFGGGFLTWWFSFLGKRKPDLPSPHSIVPEVKMTLDQYEARLSERVDRKEKQFKTAHTEDRAKLIAQITELKDRLSNPEKALKEAQETIKSLEQALIREGNDIGADRLAKAKHALESGDFSLADALFAQIEAREALAVQSVARAAFARGQIAAQRRPLARCGQALSKSGTPRPIIYGAKCGTTFHPSFRRLCDGHNVWPTYAYRRFGRVW